MILTPETVQKLIVVVAVVDVATEVNAIADCASFVIPEADVVVLTDGDWEDILHLHPVGLTCIFPHLAQCRFDMKT